MVVLLLIIMIGTACGVGWILRKVREKVESENAKLEEKYERQETGNKENS